MSRLLKPYWLLLPFLLCFYRANAQYDPLYSQYMFNIQAFNPAYAGSWSNAGLTLVSRQQWIDFENNPTSNSISFQYPASHNKAGMGFSILNDNIGNWKRNFYYLDYSYGISVSDNTTLRMGLKAGVQNFRNKLAGFELIEPNDPAFLNERTELWMPNFGLGTFIFNSRFFTGLSINNILENDYQVNVSKFILVGGIVFNLAEGIDFKPAFSVVYDKSLPLIADVNASFLFAGRVCLGIMYRTTDDLNLGLNASLLLGENLRLGYAYDMMHNAGLSAFSTGTHEIMLSYEFSINRTSFYSPRYF